MRRALGKIYLFNYFFKNFLFKHDCLNSDLDTHCSDTLVVLQLWRVRKKNYKFLTYMHVHMYWGDVKWYVRTVVGTMYSYTDFDDDIFPLLRRNFIFIWFAVFLIFIFFFNESWWYCMHIHSLNVSVHITTRHDNEILLLWASCVVFMI